MTRFIAIDYRPCTGCKACEVVCSLHHFSECNPWRSAIHVIRREKNGLVFSLPLVCQQCEQAPCIEACPTEALFKDGGQSGRGQLTIDREKCTSCELCVEACPIGAISMDIKSQQVIFCDFCHGQPQCVMACHAHCLTELGKNEAKETQNAEYLASVLEEENLRNHLLQRRVRS